MSCNDDPAFTLFSGLERVSGDSLGCAGAFPPYLPFLGAMVSDTVYHKVNHGPVVSDTLSPCSCPPSLVLW